MSKQPRLPPEIWRLIFATATDHDILLDTSQKSVFASRPHLGLAHGANPVILPQIRASIREKLSLISVSKAWHSIGYDLLLEVVCFTKESQLEQFIARLVAETTRPMNQLVRWMHVEFRDTASATTPKLVLQALVQCSNIEIYTEETEWSRSRVPSQHIQILRNCRLRYAYWSPSVYILHQDLVHLAASQNLEILSSALVHQLANLSRILPTPLIFPQVHTIDISSTLHFDVIARWEMPSLHTVRLLGGEISTLSSFNLLTPKIKALECYVYYDDILSGCTASLEECIIPVARTTVRPPPITTVLSGLKRIGLTHIQPDLVFGIRPALAQLFREFDYYHSNAVSLPTLKYLRLLRFKPVFNSTSWTEENVNLWRGWEQKWDALGVKIEDGCGQQIRLPQGVEWYHQGNEEVDGDSEEEELEYVSWEEDSDEGSEVNSEEESDDDDS